MKIFELIGSACVGALTCFGFLSVVAANPITILALPLVFAAAMALAYYGLLSLNATMRETQTQTDIKAIENAELTALRTLAGPTAEDIYAQVRGARKIMRELTDIRTKRSDVKELAGIRELVYTSNLIISEILHDPKDFRVARTFLNSQLPQIHDIVLKYMSLFPIDKLENAHDLRNSFESTLTQFNFSMNQLLHDLQQNDTSALKIDMEVLNDQLKIDNIRSR